MAALWFAGVALSDTRLSFEGQSVPVRGARAYVEEDGDVVRRTSPVRVALVALRALRGQVGPRELVLFIEGPGYQFVVPCESSQASRARSFAAAISTAGARPADAPIRRGAGPGFPRAVIASAPAPAPAPAPEPVPVPVPTRAD